ncbi:MAG: hypothetical protein KAG72_10295 [Abyssibacter sp.]|nr:hypothetical protein [Abyssibacter sp.]MCK5859724.1 hypothetical protein [Abyssibacter sp.]
MTEQTTTTDAPTARTVRVLDVIATVALLTALASFGLAFAVPALIGLFAVTPVAVIVFFVCSVKARPNHVSKLPRTNGPVVSLAEPGGSDFHRFGPGSVLYRRD